MCYEGSNTMLAVTAFVYSDVLEFEDRQYFILKTITLLS